MDLNELFVSYSQVSPVKFDDVTPEYQDPIYINRTRAKKAATPVSEDVSEEITPEESVDMSTWVVGSYKGNSPQDSSKLIDYLKAKEGFREYVYSDTGGVPTIGYGFTSPEIIAKGHLTEKEAEELLKKDISERVKKLRSQISNWDDLTQNQRDALTSYGFNVGVENWAKTQPKLLAALNEGRFEDAAKYIDAVRDKKGVVQPGLVKRRKEERDWFNS